jgi:hypothetical protein
MEDIICRHQEVVDSTTHIGTCRLCHQQTQYDEDERRILRLIKRGSIDGQQTMIRPPSLETKTKKDEEKAQEVKNPAPSLLPRPQNWDSMNMYKRARFYDNHRDLILKVISEAGDLQVGLKRLGISQATYKGLARRWQGLSAKGGSRKRRGPSDPKSQSEKEIKERREPFKNEPLNKRTGVRALWRF